MIGYIGMTITVVLSLKGNIPILFWRLVSLVILLHVIMVWSFHYEWNFSMSVRNGYGGFLIFHSALMLIIVSNYLKETFAIILIRISALIVTAGALGAVFRYDMVSVYKAPVLICAAMILLSFVKLSYGWKKSSR
jgi:hypothetical protein